MFVHMRYKVQCVIANLFCLDWFLYRIYNLNNDTPNIRFMYTSTTPSTRPLQPWPEDTTTAAYSQAPACTPTGGLYLQYVIITCYSISRTQLEVVNLGLFYSRHSFPPFYGPLSFHSWIVYLFFPLLSNGRVELISGYITPPRASPTVQRYFITARARRGLT